MVIREDDEVIRYIAARLMKTVIAVGDLLAENFCPLDFDVELFQGFPTATNSDEGWTQLFDDYLDQMFGNGKIPES